MSSDQIASTDQFTQGMINQAILEVFDRCKNVPGSGFTEMFADLWMGMHALLPNPPPAGELPPDAFRFINYMQLGNRTSINPFDPALEPLFLRQRDKDGNLSPRDNEEGKWIEKRVGYPAALVAEETARRIAVPRVMRGIAETIAQKHPGDLVDCEATGGWQNGIFTGAYAYPSKEPSFQMLINRHAKHIHLITHWDNWIAAAYSMRASIEDTESPEYGYTTTWHVAIFNEQFPFALLDRPFDFISLLSRQPDRLWFVGKGMDFNLTANNAAKDLTWLCVSVFYHATAFFSRKSLETERRLVQAWCDSVSAADDYLHSTEDDYSGVPKALTDAMSSASKALKSKSPAVAKPINEHLRYWKHSEIERKAGRLERGAYGWSPVTYDLELLPKELRKRERARWHNHALDRSTPQPQAPTGKPCPKCGKLGPHRCRL